MPGKYKRLIEVKKFSNAFIENGGNATQAAHKMRKYTTESARDAGSKMLKRVDVQEEIKRALEITGIDYEYVLGSRKKFIEAGIRQLDGRKGKKESIVTSKDTHSHLLGVESVLSRLGGNDNNNNKNTQHLHLHLEEKNQKELLTKRQELAGWFSNIIDGD